VVGRSFSGCECRLVLAEVKVSDPNQRIELPPWIAEEITHNPRYGNSRLARGPIPSAARAA
jgi:adenylate cyclase